MLFKFTRAAVAAAALSMSSAGAFAAVRTVNTTIDINDSTYDGRLMWTQYGAFDAFSTTLFDGDTSELNIDFVGNQSVTIATPAWVSALLWSFDPSTSGGVTSGSSLTFLGASGESLFTTTAAGEGYGATIMGGGFFSSFGGLASPLTFYGLKIVANNVQLSSADSATYTQASLSIRTSSVVLNQATTTSPTPEPHTWALMILGFGAAGALLRRPRAAVSAA